MLPTGCSKTVTGVCVDMGMMKSGVCSLATSEHLTEVKSLMKSESVSVTGWWMRMVINAACFILSSGVLLLAMRRWLSATLHRSLTDTL